MAAGILIFLVLSAPGVWCAASRGRRYEELLSISTMGIVLVLFVFGQLGVLEYGVHAVLLLALAFYGMTGIALWKGKSGGRFLNNLFTPGFFIFLAAYAALHIFNRGRLANTFDEFSHWIDVVKVMTGFDAFATRASAYSGFASYPPGMALFQYFFQKIRLLCVGNWDFSEEYAYVAYQVLTFSLMFPFLRKLTVKKPMVILLGLVAVFAAPMMFHNFFASLFIDAFLGVCSGAGMAVIFTYKDREKGLLYSLYIGMACAMLSLAKDVGLLFAVFLAGAYVLDRWVSGRKRLLPCLLVVLSAIVPKLLWTLELRMSEAVPNYPASYVGELSWDSRLAILRQYALGLYERICPIGDLGLGVSYIGLFFLSLAGLCLLYAFCQKRGSEGIRGKMVVAVALALQMIVYIIGLALVYMFGMTEFEGTNLVCFERYIGTAFLPVWCLAVLFGLNAVSETQWGSIAQQAALLFAMLAVVPTRPLVNLVCGNYVSISRADRAEYDEITDSIQEICEEGSVLYFVNQEHDGGDFWTIKFLVRPCILKNAYEWSLGVPSEDNLFYSQDKTAQQWRRELVEEYDYVVLYHLDDYFFTHYPQLFEDPGQIVENGLYRVDKENGLLILCNGEE